MDQKEVLQHNPLGQPFTDDEPERPSAYQAAVRSIHRGEPPSMMNTVHAEVAQLLRRGTRRSLLFAAVVAALTGGVLYSGASPAEIARQPTARIDVAAAHSPAPSGPSSDVGCWVTGDLVGDANPAAVVAALCGLK
jgi:hypothetical protein